jgi:hypothetical protein
MNAASCNSHPKPVKPAHAKEAVKSSISPRDIAEYASALEGQSLEVQRQNIPLQRIDLQLQPGDRGFW